MQSSAVESDAFSQPAEAGWGAPLALAAAIFGVYFFVSMCSTIWDRDEARFSRATAEMVATGNYLYPTFNGKLRPDKPILIYWLMSIPVRLFGHTEWAYRLCSVCGTALACFCTYLTGRKLFSHRTGLWAMAMLAANPLMLYTGAVATSDAVLLAFIAASLAVFADALKKNRLSAWHAAALTLLFAGGFLTKGPVALLPLIPFCLTSLVLRRELGGALPAILKMCGAALGAGVIFLAWFYPANRATHGDLYEQMFVHHVVERIRKPLEHHGGYSFFYLIFYPLVVLAGFFSWTLYLPGALVRLCGGEEKQTGEHGFFKALALHVLFALTAFYTGLRRLVDGAGEDRRGRALLLLWIATFLIVMILVSTKLPHYILPIWPALALCVGAYLDATAPEDALSAGAAWTVLGGFLFIAAALIAAAAFALGPDYLSGTFGEWMRVPSAGIGFAPESVAFFPKRPDPAWLSYADDSRSLRSVCGALILIVAVSLLFRHKTAHFAANARTLLIAALIFIVGMGALLLPNFEHVKISADLAAQIRAHVAGDTPVTVCGYNEASLIFYLNRNVDDIVPEKPVAKGSDAAPPKADPQAGPKIVEEAVAAWAGQSGPGVLVIPRAMYERIKSGYRMPALNQIGEVKNGFNYSKGHWADVLALRREN